jgi:hypothetical protein
MDNNHFPINFLAHPLNGAVFYVLPRLNDQSVATSAAYAYATSFAWEFLIEFREKVSINDLVVTLGAGIPVGEFANKFWRYVNGLPEHPTTAQRIGAYTAGAPYWVHRRVDGDPATTPPPSLGGSVEPTPPSLGGSVEPTPPYDDLGYSSAVGQRLYTGYRIRLHHDDAPGSATTTHGAILGGRLSTIPGEGYPGSFTLFFHEADVVSLHLDAGVGENARELDLLTDTYLIGVHTQHLDGPRANGHAATLGLSLAYRYRFQDFDSYNDRFALLHMPAPGADYHYRAGPLHLHTHWRINGDFAGIHSHAYSTWAATHVGPNDRPKSILRKHNYYYAWGLSSRLGTTVELGPVDLAAKALLATYDSQENLDRAQEELTLDPDAKDRILELDANLGFTLPTTRLRLGIGWSTTKRWSRVEQTAVTRQRQTFSLGILATL